MAAPCIVGAWTKAPISLRSPGITVRTRDARDKAKDQDAPITSTVLGQLEPPHRHAAMLLSSLGHPLWSQAPRPRDAPDTSEGSERTSWHVSVPSLLPRSQGKLSRAPDGICVPLAEAQARLWLLGIRWACGEGVRDGHSGRGDMSGILKDLGLIIGEGVAVPQPPWWRRW